MNIRGILKVSLVALFILGTVSGSQASANGGGDIADECEALGGFWWGAYGSRTTGTCTFTPGHIEAEPECADAGLWTVFIFGENYYYGYECAANTHDLIDGSFGFLCEGYGGIWVGDAGNNGTCTFPVQLEFVDEFCPPGYQPVITVENNDIVGEPACVLPSSPESPTGTPSPGTRSPGFSMHGGKIKDDAAGSAALGGGKNGSFFYDVGTCAAGCEYTQTLPGGATADLPGEASATLYIRIADGGTGTYTVCFNVGDLTSPVIYRYVSGVWVVVASTVSGGQVCTSASGDGAFALGSS
ncbi:MAG: hypothetical protein EPO32_13215 [Anaerolineae bacterium]|nr:MAG: hypothetical protein EPO32_13215 [Anaerolineae bacterium]